MLHALTLGLFAGEARHEPVSERRREPGNIQARICLSSRTPRSHRRALYGTLPGVDSGGSRINDLVSYTRSTSTLSVRHIAVSSVSLSLNGLESGAATDLLLRNGCFAAAGETFRTFVH